MKQPVILCIESSTNICSVALFKGNRCINTKLSTDEKSHATLLTVFIEEILNESETNPSEIDAVAISMGPGSYTGLRIGVSAAKGICYGASAKLIAVNTLELMAQTIMESVENKSDAIFAPMIDARRMEIYSSFFDKDRNVLKDISADIIDENSYSEFYKDNKLYIGGNGAAKCKEVIKSENVILVDNIYPSADKMGTLALEKFNNNIFEDVAYFEPFYLKDFVVTKSKKKLF